MTSPTQPAEAVSVKRFWVADEDVHERTPISIEFGSHDIYVLASDHDAVVNRLEAARDLAMRNYDYERRRADAALARVKELERLTNYHENCKTCRCADPIKPEEE